MRNKNKLWKMLEREQKGVKLFYDSTKRDPQFAQGEHSFLNELHLLEKHYHPSVQRMAKFIIENYNKDIISYNGDPLLDFSLTNFLEKFMLKNPKIKKEKKEVKKIENDDDELKKFIEGEDNEKNNINNNNNLGNEIRDENDFEFIDKFNRIYPEITNDKNYLKKIKKKEKKMKTEEDVDEMIGDQEFGQENDDIEMEKFADKVIDDEYKKYNKDIDEDDLGDDNEENNNNENEEVDDLFTEDEEEIENEGMELQESEEEENKEINDDKKMKNKGNKKGEKDSGFVDAETYYKSLKNKKKKIK